MKMRTKTFITVLWIAMVVIWAGQLLGGEILLTNPPVDAPKSQPLAIDGLPLVPGIDVNARPKSGWVLDFAGFDEIRNWPVATCDPRRALDEYAAGIAAKAIVTKQIETAQEQVRTLARQLAIRQKNLGNLKKKARKVEEVQLPIEQAKLKKFINNRGKQLDDIKQAVNNANAKAVYAAIATVAKAKGVDLVLSYKPGDIPQGSALYASESLDITDDVIELLNKEASSE